MNILQEKIAGKIKIINQDNAGLSAAKNTGINAANGEYIGYVTTQMIGLFEFLRKVV